MNLIIFPNLLIVGNQINVVEPLAVDRTQQTSYATTIAGLPDELNTRFKPNSLAPDWAGWGYDNRGAMMRVQGGFADPATHIENRVGEPAANPYLYMASQIIAGINGIEQKLNPGALSDEPYAADRPALPKSLMEAIEALKKDTLFHTKMGRNFVEFMIKMKESKTSRFLSAMDGKPPEAALEQVTQWEQREYFSLF